MKTKLLAPWNPFKEAQTKWELKVHTLTDFLKAVNQFQTSNFLQPRGIEICQNPVNANKSFRITLKT